MILLRLAKPHRLILAGMALAISLMFLGRVYCVSIIRLPPSDYNGGPKRGSGGREWFR